MQKYVFLLLVTIGVAICCNFETPYRHGIRSGSSLAARMFSKRNGEVHWHYTRTSTSDGPRSWASLNPDWPCDGRRQSPIDISRKKATTCSALPPLKVSYPKLSGPVIYHNGHVVQVDVPAGGAQPVISGGPLPSDFTMVQFHFHSVSEHQFDDMSTIAEVHFVHKSIKDPSKLAVIGILLAEGPQNQKSDPFFNQFINQYAKLKEPGDRQSFPSLSFASLLKRNVFSSYYTYDGSLTTPPCSETVTWIVLSKPLLLSPVQAQIVSKLISRTNRPVQPLGTRTVYEGSNIALSLEGVPKGGQLGAPSGFKLADACSNNY